MNKPFPFSLFDLTHTLDETIPTWACCYDHENLFINEYVN